MAKALNQQLAPSRELAYVTQRDPLLGSLLRKIVAAANTLAKNAAVSAVGKLPPPTSPDSVQVQGTFDPSTNTITAPSEHLHFTIEHNSAIQKGINYLSELSTDQNFSQPHIIDHGASRSGFISLPTFQNDGKTLNTYYLRTMAQYAGSDPSKPTVVGGVTGATKIVMTGASATTLLPSQGSGTAPNGQKGGVGLGKVLDRPAPQPKRSLK